MIHIGENTHTYTFKYTINESFFKWKSHGEFIIFQH